MNAICEWRELARRAQGRRSYAIWLESRLRRLVWPLLPLLVAGLAIVAIEYARGVRPELIRYGSQVAFIPVWFVAVHIVIVRLVSATAAVWTPYLIDCGMGAWLSVPRTRACGRRPRRPSLV
jgi:hypothetical protein